MMQPPKHVLLELDEDGDLHSVESDSDAPAVVGATEGDSPPAPARPAIAGAVPVADPTPEERRTAATPVSMLTPTLPGEAPTRRAGLRARPKQRDLSWGPGDNGPGPSPGHVAKACEMRRIGDAEWRWFGSYTDAAKAFGLNQGDVSRLINPVPHLAPKLAPGHVRKTFEARPAPPKKRKQPTKERAPRKKRKYVEGAWQKQNGKWTCPQMFPGREFDDLDEYRAAKKQRAEWRAAYFADNKHQRH